MEFFIDSILLDVDYEPGSDGKWSTTWNTIGSNDGYHDIAAQATDNRGRTAFNRISVISKNSPGNIPPVATLDYSLDGNKYYFYRYECYDPDGDIVKFEYRISEIGNPLYEEYACCMYNYGNLSAGTLMADICGKEGPECSGPAQDSGFGLSYTCPYIYYQSERKSAEYKVELRVWDNEGAVSNTAVAYITIVTVGSSHDMYVWEINPRVKPTGSRSTLGLIVTVRHDSNQNGQSDSNDFPLPGALVRIELSKDTYVLPDEDFDLLDPNFNISIAPPITNRDGQAVFQIKALKRGDYRATLLNITLLDYEYNPALDIVNSPNVSIW